MKNIRNFALITMIACNFATVQGSVEPDHGKIYNHIKEAYRGICKDITEAYQQDKNTNQPSCASASSCNPDPNTAITPYQVIYLEVAPYAIDYGTTSANSSRASFPASAATESRPESPVSGIGYHIIRPTLDSIDERINTQNKK